MDGFNYLSVMVSIVLGLGLTQLFAGIGRGVAEWTYATFVYVLIGPAALVIASHIIIPELLDGRIDVERHYFDTSPLFFAILTIAAVWATFLEPIMGLRSFFVPFRFLQAAGVTAFVACAASKNRRLHGAAIALIVLILVTGITLDRFSLGQFNLR